MTSLILLLLPFPALAFMPWPGGGTAGYPSDPADRIRHDREEAVVGNGYMTAMLDRNGSLYDLYFPSVGLRAKSGTANEGYRGPQAWPQDCSLLDAQANGQMNVINGTGGIGIGTNIYWLTNLSSNYVDVGQRWLSDDTLVVVTSNRLNVAGNDLLVEQYDFVPVASVLPVVGDSSRTNRAVYVKRFLLTNREATDRTVDFYWDVNFNVKGDNAHDVMAFTNNTMIVYDNAARTATGTWCAPDGYGNTTGTQYDPSVTGAWDKGNSVYFGTALKLVTNSVSGAGAPADGSWRDHTAIDHQEGWLGKTVTIPAGHTLEVDVMIVGSWDDFAGATGTHDFWGVPLVNWFFTNNLATAQAATAAYWSNWLAGGVTVDFPDDTYDRLFKRSLLVSALHADAATGAILAGMHNGAYPFVWPRDGVYAANTFVRTGHTNEAAAFYGWLESAERDFDSGIGDKGFFFQKYTTDGKPVWRSPQVDETASIPWGIAYYHLVTGDGGFVTNHWNLTYTSARAASEDSTISVQLYYDDTFHLMHGNNVWEDQYGVWLYSNASVVRGLRDAAALAAQVGSNGWATTFQARAEDILTNGILPRIDARVETSDISQLGLAYPFEVLAPADPRMTNVVEWLHGRQTAGGFAGGEGNLVETNSAVAGLLRRYNHKTANNYGDLDDYWNGGPWFLASSWYGMHFARWQDHVGGKSLVSTNKVMLDQLIAKLGPLGLGAEQIAANTSEQKYAGFWLQTAWPNTWESHTTFVDQMLLFLDYQPLTNNTCRFAPKLPTGWASLGFSNLLYRAHRFDFAITEGNQQTRADINRHTAGALAAELYLRIPAGEVPAAVVTNNTAYSPNPADYDLGTGRVRIAGPLPASAGNTAIIVTYGTSDLDGDGLTDAAELTIHGTKPLVADSDTDGMPDGYEVNHRLNPNVDDAAADHDGDGQGNLAEFLAGTAADDAGSLLKVLSLARAGNVATITWASVTGKSYDVRASTNLVLGYFGLTNNLPATGTITSYTDPAAIETNRFYQIQLHQ